ncbi:MAG: DUF1501 domain-containing protein [Planctomycetes bacterium]|nr:DUF1501 domain-containing protein [Planctomycetota bacterium]
MRMNRRQFLRVGRNGLLMGAMAPLLKCPFISRTLQAAMLGTSPAKKMLVIFLRGGMDGANVLIPHGDPDYNDNFASRPTLFIPPEDAYDLNGFASAHPSLEKVVELVPTNNVAWIHRVGYAESYFSQSHFDGQQFWENAQPGSVVEHGWVNRLIYNATGLRDVTFPAASISTNLQVLFRGPDPLAHIQDLADYSLDDIGISEKLLGAVPNGDNGTGLLGVYSRAPDPSGCDDLVRGHGLALTSSLQVLDNLDPDSYVPEGGATYPDSGNDEGFNQGRAFTFFRELRDAVILLKQTDCRVVGIQLDGFDTHAGQESELEDLLEIVGHGIWATYADTAASIWNDLMIVTLSEFGRTSQENGSSGTDHGEASCMMIAGGGVTGGVYNCDSTTWADGDLFSSSSARYIKQKTDFRAVLAEIVDRHFGQPGILNTVIPSWNTLSGSNATYDYLNFLPSV